MKTFKEYVSEGFSNAGMPVLQQQWQDQDAMPSAETAVEALNAFVGAIGDHEYMNPRIAFKKLEENLQKLGYHFDMPTIDSGEGEYSLPLRMVVELLMLVMMKILMENLQKVMEFQNIYKVEFH